MHEYAYTPRGVCSQRIRFTLDNGKLRDVSFTGGCDGNLKAIGKLLEGQDAENAVRILKGNDCRGRGTSCADQLARAGEEALRQEQAGA